MDRLAGTWHVRPAKLKVMLSAMLSGEAWPTEVPTLIRANERSVVAMTPELLTVDLATSIKELLVPVAFFLGKFDRQVSETAARPFIGRLRAPRKALVMFDQSAHNVPFEEPAAFSACLLQTLSEIVPLKLPGVSCPYRPQAPASTQAKYSEQANYVGNGDGLRFARADLWN